MMKLKLLTVGLLFVFVAGCTSPADIILNPVQSGLERAAGEHIEKKAHETAAPDYETTASGETPSPGTGRWNQYMIAHAQTVFSHSFSVGGLWPGLVGYEGGDWTRFQINYSENSEKVTVERALLKVREDGSRWWKLSWSSSGEKWVYEALVDAEGKNLLRLRGKGPNGEVKEIPVEKGTAVNLQTRELTEESIRGAVRSTAELEVPAGSFRAREASFGMVNWGGDVIWWLNDDVPGGVVKYEVHSEDGTRTWASELLAYGTGAETALDSY